MNVLVGLAEDVVRAAFACASNQNDASHHCIQILSSVSSELLRFSERTDAAKAVCEEGETRHICVQNLDATGKRATMAGTKIAVAMEHCKNEKPATLIRCIESLTTGLDIETIILSLRWAAIGCGKWSLYGDEIFL